MIREKRDTAEAGEPDTSEGYLRYSRKKWLFLAALTVALVLLSLFILRMGPMDLSYREIMQYIFSPDDSWDSKVVRNVRLKVIIAAILAGSALSIAGCVMQSILRNPLASPFTLGLSNAAAFGASLGILFFHGGLIVRTADVYATISNPLVVTVLAFAFAMLATGIVILLVKVTECTPETIILAGLAISSIFSAGLAFLQYMADEMALSEIVFWQFGSLSKVEEWSHLYIVAVVLFLAAAYFIYKRWDYNAMESGEDVASGLGVNIKSTRYIGLTISALLTAVVVSFMGIIGFIGLIGPHIVKRIVGNDNRYTLIGSMIVGSMVLLVASIIGNNAFHIVIPVGIITSAIGGPLFIFILLMGRRNK
ncbi:MAG: iron ABC transporter permease [Methanomassiliicoccaceae archaeon]|nr:iron ABC transporter permease [Methanomassiliicoccaceae archaeon]